MGRMPKDQDTEIIQLVMGSDPAKAPRGINRWGAALETFHSQTGTGYFFGLMKASKGKSVSEMEGELERENTDQDASQSMIRCFIWSRTSQNLASFSSCVPL
jgi:hypothetical protein